MQDRDYNVKCDYKTIIFGECDDHAAPSIENYISNCINNLKKFNFAPGKLHAPKVHAHIITQGKIFSL